MIPKQKAPKGDLKKLSHMRVNRLSRDDYELREKYMETPSIEFDKRKK